MHRSLQVLMIEAWGLRGALRATTNCYTEERLDAAPCAVRSQQAGMPCSSWVLFGDIFDGKVHVDSVDLDVLPEFTQRAREVRAS